MTDTSQPAPDPLRAWREAAGRGAAPSGDGGAPEVASRRPTRLLAAAAVTTAIALFLLTGAARQRPAPAGVPAATAPLATSLPTSAPSATSEPPAPSPVSAAVPSATAAAAVLAVRASAPDDIYVDTAVVDGGRAHGEITVVTVRALVLPRTGDDWGEARHARYAVAVGSTDGRVGVLSGPWRVAAVESPAAERRWADVADAALLRSVTDAVRQQGYSISGPVQTRRAPSLAGVVAAVFRGVADGESAPRRHEVWLDETGTSVLGGEPAPPPDLPVPQP